MGMLAATIAGLVIAAVSLLVAGIEMLAGPAWAMISLGLLLFAAAVYLRQGLTPGG